VSLLTTKAAHQEMVCGGLQQQFFRINRIEYNILRQPRCGRGDERTLRFAIGMAFERGGGENLGGPGWISVV
jgi:hypothetical protein